MSSEEVLLRDLLLSTKDGEWGRGEPGDGLIPMGVIRGTDFEAVRLGNLDDLPLRYIPEHLAVRKALQLSDIVIETAGGTKDRPTGRTVFLRDELIGSSSQPLTCASFSRYLRVNPELAEPEYVFWYLQYLYSVGEMEHHQVQHTGVARFQYTTFAASTAIPLPGRERQRSICDTLRQLDEKIALNRRMNHTLESMARATFKSWFVDFDPVRNKREGSEMGLSSDLVALFPDSLINADYGLRPDGWSTATLEDVAHQVRDQVQPNEMRGETPYIGLEHLPRRSIALSEWGVADGVVSAKSRFSTGDILFGKLRPYFHKVGPAPVDGVCSTDIVVVRPRHADLGAFVLGHLSSDDFVSYATGGSTGTRMPRTSWKDMAVYPLLLPPGQVLGAYQAVVQPLLRRIQNSIFESRKLVSARELLLPQLLTGRLPVEDARRGNGQGS